MKPYVDEKISEKRWIRTFDPSFTESNEYVWHRDYNDRNIKVLEGNGWKFQFDNELPFDINTNEEIYIPKMVYHRIIPGSAKLRIEINEEF